MLWFAAVFLMCTKEKREIQRIEKLEGKWELIYMTSGMPYSTWDFDNDSLKTFTHYMEGLGYRTSSYFLTNDNYKYYITLDSIDHTSVDGKYLILKLSKDILVLERVEWEQESNPFYRREFIRIE